MGVATLRLVDKYVTGRIQERSMMSSSARAARGALRRFATFMPEVHQITRGRVLKWLKKLNATVSPGTARSYFSHVKVFCQWLVLEGHLDRDPTLGIRPPKKPDYQPRALEPWEVAAVLRACNDQRERLMVMLAVQEALRCCEVAALQLADIDQRRGLVTVYGKGGKYRTVPLVDDARRELARYLADTHITAGPLFPSRWNPHVSISANWVSELVGNIFRRSGIKKRAYDGKSAHALRHTCLSDVVDGDDEREGGDILEAQEIAGHADLSTTRGYMRHRRAERLRDVMEGRHYDDAEPARWADTG